MDSQSLSVRANQPTITCSSVATSCSCPRPTPVVTPDSIRLERIVVTSPVRWRSGCDIWLMGSKRVDDVLLVVQNTTVGRR